MRLLLFILLSFTTITVTQATAQNYHKTVNPDNLSEVLHLNSGQKRVLLVYASWCPHCQVIFPQLIEIERNHPGSIIAISMDNDLDRFKRFTHKFPDLPIDQLIWNKEYHLGASLYEQNISFSGYIPFIALIDKNGKVVKQGHVSADDIKIFLQ